jgi:hypothetical protein
MYWTAHELDGVVLSVVTHMPAACPAEGFALGMPHNAAAGAGSDMVGWWSGVGGPCLVSRQ